MAFGDRRIPEESGLEGFGPVADQPASRPFGFGGSAPMRLSSTGGVEILNCEAGDAIQPILYGQLSWRAREKPRSKQYEPGKVLFQ
jgi:hypothetical protein